jgi:exodeoxyribonuclease VII large subunit
MDREVREKEQKLRSLLQRALAARRHRFEGLAGRLDNLSPLRVLARGYAVAFDDRGHALTNAAQVGPGERLRVRLHVGELSAHVLSRDDGTDA